MKGWSQGWWAKRSPRLSAALAALALLLALGGWTWDGWTPLFMDKEIAFLMGAAYSDEDPNEGDPWGGRVQLLVRRVGCCGEEPVVLSKGPNGRAESWVNTYQVWGEGSVSQLESVGGDDLCRAERDVLGAKHFAFRFGDQFALWGAALVGWWALCTVFLTPAPERPLGGLVHVGLPALGALALTAGGEVLFGRSLVYHLLRLRLYESDLVHPSLYLVPFAGTAVAAALRTLAYRRWLEQASG